MREEDTPGGDCGVPVGVFQVELPGSIAVGDTIRWYGYGYYRESSEYDGLFGESSTQMCVADTAITGIEPEDVKPLLRSIINIPNPFSGSTDIMFELSAKVRVSILVYDVRGKMVDRVLETVLPQGPHYVTWNGRSGAGESLPSGIYFFRFKAGDFAVTRKTVLVK